MPAIVVVVVVVVAIFEIVGCGKGEELVLLYWNFLFHSSFKIKVLLGIAFSPEFKL